MSASRGCLTGALGPRSGRLAFETEGHAPQTCCRVESSAGHVRYGGRPGRRSRSPKGFIGHPGHGARTAGRSRLYPGSRRGARTCGTAGGRSYTAARRSFIAFHYCATASRGWRGNGRASSTRGLASSSRRPSRRSYCLTCGSSATCYTMEAFTSSASSGSGSGRVASKNFLGGSRSRLSGGSIHSFRLAARLGRAYRFCLARRQADARRDGRARRADRVRGFRRPTRANGRLASGARGPAASSSCHGGSTGAHASRGGALRSFVTGGGALNARLSYGSGGPRWRDGGRGGSIACLGVRSDGLRRLTGGRGGLIGGLVRDGCGLGGSIRRRGGGSAGWSSGTRYRTCGTRFRGGGTFTSRGFHASFRARCGARLAFATSPTPGGATLTRGGRGWGSH